MKGNEKVIARLNELLADELTAINQYMVHSEMCANWRYDKLHKVAEGRAIQEMKHAEALIGRLLFLEGQPIVSNLKKISIGANVADQHKNDLAAEEDAIKIYNDSIRLAEWPTFDASRIDENLNRDMAAIMKLASLGHAARKQAEIKVRQPLAEAMFSVANQDEAKAVPVYADLLSDELNVKKVSILGAAGEAVSYTINPLIKQLGQKYRNKMPAIRSALLQLDPDPAGRALLGGNSVTVTVDGESYDIFPEEVEVRSNAKEGLAIASDGGYLCALQTELTPELVAEGLAREFVRRVQDLRKSAEFDVADRIELTYTATPTLAAAIEKHRDYIMGETLTVNLHAGESASSQEVEFDGEKVRFGIRKAGA